MLRIVEGATREGGVVAAGELFDARDLLRSLGPELVLDLP